MRSSDFSSCRQCSSSSEASANDSPATTCATRATAGGPPDLAMRLLAPVLVLLTVTLFATGIELWLFGFAFGNEWLIWHKASFVLWFLAMTVHVAAYARRAPAL